MWDIYSVGDGEFLASVLNAVAMLTGTGDFATLVRIGFGIGVLLIALQGALSGGRGIDWQHAMIGLVIYMVMFGPQVRVNVEDMYSGQVYPVDNVPFGVAATGSVLSRAGYSITTLFETAFGTPAMTEQSYGMSLKRLQATREAMLNRINTGEANSPIPGSDVEKSWVNYVQECTLTAIDLHEQNPTAGLSLDSVLNGRLPDALHFADSEFYFTEIYVGGTPQTLNCDQAFVQLANFTNNVFLPAAKQNIKAFMAPDSFLTTDQLLEDAMYGIEQYGVNIDTYLKAVYLTPIYGDAVVQHHLGSKQDVMAAIVNEAVQRRNAQWQAQKSVFETSVQPFMTFMEALFYALTPIMGLVIGLGMMGMKMIGKYLVLALWVQMWMPVMAIVNHYIHAAAAGKISSVLAAVVSEPMSITGMAQWDGIIQNQLAVGGMLASSVPIIALFIVSGSYYALTNVAGQMTGQDHIDESKGAPKTSAPVTFGPMQQWDAERGLHGSEAQSAMTTFSWSAQDAQQTASSQEAMHAATGNFSSMLGQRVSAMSGTSQKGGESFSFGSGTRVGNSQSEGMLRQQAESLSDKWSHAKGISSETLASFGAAAAAGNQTPAQLSAGIKQNTKLTESESNELANDLLSKFSEDESWNAQYNQQVAKEFSQGSENIYTRGTGLSEDKQLQEAAQESYSATEKYNEAVTSGVTVGTRQDVDGVKAGKNLAANSDANARLQSAITGVGLKGAVDQWMASASGEDTIRQMGGDRDAAEAYAMLLTANGQNQYADNSQLSASSQGILQDTANSALAQTFGQVGGPAFGDRASSNADIADGHVPQRGSVEGQVSNAVGDMRVPQADQVRGNASMGLAHAQQQSHGPSDQSMYGDYQGRTDHIQAASNPSFEEFKAEDQAMTRGEVHENNNRGAFTDTSDQAPHAAAETASNIGMIAQASWSALTGGSFSETHSALQAEAYQSHYDYAKERDLTDEQATLYARTAMTASAEHRAVDWVGNNVSSNAGELMGWNREYEQQTAELATKLDPEISTSIQKAAYEGEGDNEGRLERIADLNNSYHRFPEREALASNSAPATPTYEPGSAFNSFMPPETTSNDGSAVTNEQHGSGLASDEPYGPAPDAASSASELAPDYGATNMIEGPAAATEASPQPHDGAPSGEGAAQPGMIDTGAPTRSEASGQSNGVDEPFIPSIDSIPSENAAGYGHAPTPQATAPATSAASAAQTSPSREPAADRMAPTTFESSIAPEPGMGMTAGYEQPARTMVDAGAPSASYPASNDPTPAGAGTGTMPELNESNTALEPESAIDPGAIQSREPNSVGSSSQPADDNQGLSWTMAGSFAAAGADTVADNAAVGASWTDTTPVASYDNDAPGLSEPNQPTELSQPEPAVAQTQTDGAEQSVQPPSISSADDSAGIMASPAPAFAATDSTVAEPAYGTHWADTTPTASYDNDAPDLTEPNQPSEPSQPEPAMAQANGAGLNAQSAPASSADTNSEVAPSMAPAFAAADSNEAEPAQGANWADNAPAASYDNDAPGLSELNQPSEPSQPEHAMSQANGAGADVQRAPVSSTDDSAGMMASASPAFTATANPQVEPTDGSSWSDNAPPAPVGNESLGLAEQHQQSEPSQAGTAAAHAEPNAAEQSVQTAPITGIEDSTGTIASPAPAFTTSESNETEPAYSGHWADTIPAAPHDNGALGLSEPSQSSESPSEPAAEHAQQQDSDWFNDAFGSNQGGTSDRQTTVRAAEEEQLRQEMLETIVVDESDVRDGGSTFGQDMGRS